MTGQEECKVEKVHRKKKKGGGTLYLVSWFGWTKKFGALVSEDQIQNVSVPVPYYVVVFRARLSKGLEHFP